VHRFSRLQQRLLTWWAADPQRTRGVTASSHQEWVRAFSGDKGNISQRLRTLEARGLLVIGRSPGGQAQCVRLTTEGQKGAWKFAGSGE
jgi:hypothetical protein